MCKLKIGDTVIDVFNGDRGPMNILSISPDKSLVLVKYLLPSNKTRPAILYAMNLALCSSPERQKLIFER